MSRHFQVPNDPSLPYVVTLCEELVPGAAPQVVELRPTPGAPPNECFPLVSARVREDRGALVCGWSIWEYPTLFVEAEFHAVWKKPDGSLLDITLKNHAFNHILFLIDPSREYGGRQVDNIRRAMRSDSAITGFIKAAEDEFEFMNRGERAFQHGQIAVTGNERAEIQEIMMRKASYFARMLQLPPRMEPYQPCWCGSGKKAKWCHNSNQTR